MSELPLKHYIILAGLLFTVGIATNLIGAYAWNTYLNKQKEKTIIAKLTAIRAAQIRKGNSYTAAHSARIIEGDRRY